MRKIRSIVYFVIWTKLAILSFGYVAYLLLSTESSKRFVDIWIRWDALSYINIAQEGYTSLGQHRWNIVFLPLYPLLISIFTPITRDSGLSGLFVSGFASVLLAIAFHKLVAIDHNSHIADLSLWFFFVFPTAYVLHIPYTESTFLAIVVASFLAARKDRWLLAGLLGAVACATRINGLILCLALPMEVWCLWRQDRKFNWSWLWLGLVPIGFVAYLSLNYFVFGDPFAFMAAQREHWQKFLANPIPAVFGKLRGVLAETRPTQMLEGAFELIFLAFGILTTLIGWRSMRASYRVWMVASLLLFVSTSFILSVPRYTLTLFPMFIVMAIVFKKPARLAVVSIISILYLALFTASFVQGRWAF